MWVCPLHCSLHLWVMLWLPVWELIIRTQKHFWVFPVIPQFIASLFLLYVSLFVSWVVYCSSITVTIKSELHKDKYLWWCSFQNVLKSLSFFIFSQILVEFDGRSQENVSKCFSLEFKQGDFGNVPNCKHSLRSFGNNRI